MNIVFWFAIIAIGVLIWFCLSFAFRGVGGVFKRLYDDAVKEINTKDDEEVRKKESK